MRKLALILFLGAAGACLHAPAWADLASGKQAYENKNYALALSELGAEAKRDKPEAMHLLGMMYADGSGVARDNARALDWFRKAAALNYGPSQGMLGMFYAQGRGVARDNAKSLEWTRAAAENGDALSQYMMGMRSLDGLGMPRDPDGAVTWFGSAAEQNYALAQYAMGVLLAFGPNAQGEAKQARELRVEGAKWLILAVRRKSPDVPNGQAKYDELKKRMGPAEIAAAEERAGKWRPAAGK